MSDLCKLVREPNQDLVLVVPPRRVDLVARRGYVLGNFLLFSGFAIIGPHFGQWDPFARVGTAALGLLAGYLHSTSAIHNHCVPLLFRFRQSGEVLVTTAKGKLVRSSPIAGARIDLQRKPKHGPGRFNWTHALACVSVDLAEEAFEALKKYGLQVSLTEPPPLHTQFTQDERRDWGLLAAAWSLPWWGVAYRLLASW
jgi:hypothetical protein